MSTRLPIALVLLASPLVADDAADESPAKEAEPKQTLITISKEVTYLTEPLDDEGFVDYLQAANDMTSKGVTTENNFEVIVRRVMGPDEISEDYLERYYQRLGIEVGDGPFFEDYTSFHGPKAGPDGREALFEEFDKLLEGPWKGEAYPRGVAWLKTVDAHLDAIVEGTRRPRFYTPYIDGEGFDEVEGPGPRLIAVLLPSVQGLREMARSLRIRANRRVADGDLDGAWEDALAMFRMGRLAGQGFTLIEALVGYAIDSMAFETTRDLLVSPELTDDLARRILADLKRLPDVPGMAERIDRGERMMGLDCVQALARAGRGNLFKSLKLLNDLSSTTPPVRVMAGDVPFATEFVGFDEAPATERPKELTINWDITSRMMNDWYDRLVEAAGTEDFDERQERFRKLNDDVKALAAKARDGRRNLLRLFTGTPRDQMGKVIGEIMVALLLPAVEQATKAEFAARARLEVLRTAVAVEVYCRDNDGNTPDSLAGLAPKYLAKVPGDPLSGKPLHYRERADALVVYSVGRNGEDDDGFDHGDAERAELADPDTDVEWDDIVVRLRLD